MVTKDKAPKEKRRNNEKRKEKSRDAARSRRSRETEIFTDLANALPLNQEQISQLDKASVMRLAISYLRVRDMVNLVSPLPAIEDKKNEIDEAAFLKTLEGFLVVISPEGDFIYLSENVTDYLGISQIDLMGQNVYEYSHPCDHDEIKEILSSKSRDEVDAPKSFFLRLKCTLTSKGRSVNLKSATYKVIHCNGHIIRNEIKKENKDDKGILQSCLVAVGKPIPHPSNIEDPLPKQTFITKHSLDMKFTHAEDKILEDILGYTADDLIGKSVYEYHHAMDSDSIGPAYKCLFSKGQTETNRYRFLAKTGGYVWVVTQATLIYDKVQKPQSVVCVNYVISGVECKDEIYSTSQYSVKPASVSTTNEKVNETVQPAIASPSKNKVTEQRNVKFKPITVTAKLLSNYVPPTPTVTVTPPSRPETATTKIFVPRTEDMSKGFLTFSEDEPGLTMLKDEPDDLTHLAPYAPLTDDNPFLSEMLDDFLLRDNFGPLLSEEPSDPFISYRDFHDSSTPELLSPNLSKNSDSSLPSLNSPTDSLGDEDQMSTFMNLQVDDDDLAMKAPYIPMNIADDLPLLLSDDLMWNSNEKNKNIPDSNSSLAQLLSSSVNKHSIKPTDHGGGIINEPNIEEIYNDKSSSNWSIKTKNIREYRLERSPSTKRSSTSDYDSSNKRSKNEPKEKMSSELLQQLMSNNHHRGRPKGKSNWLLDSGGQKAACISQPSDSVLMNLLDDPMEDTKASENPRKRLSQKYADLLIDKDKNRSLIRKNSISLLDPDGTIPSLMDLTQQDYEVNAPVHNLLLGSDLISALDGNGTM